MFDLVLRVVKDRLLMPLARWLGPRFPPNVVTIVAFALAMLAAWLAYERSYAAALVVWLVGRVLDGLDGTLARVHGRQTDFGGYIDMVLDFGAYAALPIAMAAGSASRDALLAALFLLASFYVNAASWMYLAAILERRGAGAAATGEGTTVTMPPGIIAGAETFAFYIIFLLAPRFMAPLFLLMGALVFVTVVQRLVWAVRRL